MDSTTWDKKYKDSELLWSADANIWVQDLAKDLAPGIALDVAAGEGRNALWLVARGWQVTAVDFSAVALQRARTLAETRLGIDAERLTTLEADVQTWLPPARAYDLVLVAYLHLPEKQRGVVIRAAAEAVSPGGTLLVVGHDLENLGSGHGGPQNPAVLYRPGDIVTDIEPAELIVDRSETVRRPMTDGQGRPVEALDALVVGRRPVG